MMKMQTVLSASNRMNYIKYGVSHWGSLYPPPTPATHRLFPPPHIQATEVKKKE